VLALAAFLPHTATTRSRCSGLAFAGAIMDSTNEFCDATALNTGAAGTYLIGNVVDLVRARATSATGRSSTSSSTSTRR
jgi:hypothetical protein